QTTRLGPPRRTLHPLRRGQPAPPLRLSQALDTLAIGHLCFVPLGLTGGSPALRRKRPAHAGTPTGRFTRDEALVGGLDLKGPVSRERPAFMPRFPQGL